MNFSKVILGAYAYVPLSEVGYGVRRELTVIHKYERTKFEMFKIVNNRWFGFPLYYDMSLLTGSNVLDKRVVGDVTYLKFTSEYREGQEKIINDFSRMFFHGKTGFILEAKPGSGKTVCAIGMMSIINRTTLVIVPRENLVWQWVDRLIEHSNLRRDSIGVVCGNTLVWKDRPVVVALVHTCATGKLGKGFRRRFGCVIFDEVHSSVPPKTFSPVLAMFPSKIRIGMSATLERDDGLDMIFRNHIGQVYIHGKVSGRVQANVLVHYSRINCGHIYGGIPAKNRRGMLISILASNLKRNKIIVWYIVSFLKSKRRVVVLSDRKEQLILLYRLLQEHTKRYNGLEKTLCGFYVHTLGKKVLSKRYLKNVAKCASVIFATYQKFDLGTDIQDLAGLIYAVPRKLVEQKQGRIERDLKGKKVPVAVDIVDIRYQDAIRWFKSRLNFYSSSGIKVKRVA